MRSLAVLALIASAGCAPAVALPHTDNAGRFAERKSDPKVDRCAQQKDEGRKKDCQRAKDGAVEFTRRLSVDDQICLDGNPMSDGLTSRCKARAFVTDAGVNKIKVEVREVEPGTGYRHMQEIWFTEAALADIYLLSLGYELPEPPPPPPPDK